MSNQSIPPKNLTLRAKSLRNNMTRQERRLWYTFLSKHPIRILRQKVIGRYIADFYCAAAKLVIEIDGGQHYTENGGEYDRNRAADMEKLGVETIRFSNSDIDRSFDAVCEVIDLEIGKRVNDLGL